MPKVIIAAILLVSLKPYHDEDFTAVTLRWWDTGPQICVTHDKHYGYTFNYHAVPGRYGVSFGVAGGDDVFQIVWRHGDWMFVWFVGESWQVCRN
jgi:alkanesulfonate monooxygenase SsuD/methylene tetrahydromethanopterin reductase-like flavin-dependent oxidoreductase (luciferase family)